MPAPETAVAPPSPSAPPNPNPAPPAATQTPPAPTPEAGGPVSGDPYAAAAKTLREAKGWDALTGQREAAPEVAAEPTETKEPEAPTAPDFAAWKVDNDGRLHRPDGTFAEQAEVDAYNATVTAETSQQQPATDPAATTTDPAPEPIVVKLRGRNGEDREIEVTDPETAELLRANHNDGMRGEEYRRRLGDVESREAEQREFETMMETNPEHVILRMLPTEKQVAIATALIAQHWDAIVDNIAEFHIDPSKRVKVAGETQVAIRDNQTEFQDRVARGKYIAEARRTITALIPETIDPDTQQRFLRDAETDVAAAVRQRKGQPVPVQELAELLKPRLTLYGFQQPGSATSAPAVPGAPATPPKPPARPLARPVVKAGTPATTPPAKTVATAPGESVRRTVQAQKIAAAVPPAGAGAGTVKVPLVPANATIEQASAAMKKHKTWADVGA